MLCCSNRVSLQWLVVVLSLLNVFVRCLAFTTITSSINNIISSSNNKQIINHKTTSSSLEETSSSYSWREYCNGCNRPQPQCLCDYIPPANQKIHLQTQVLILQHPVEFRRKTVSTVPLIKLILEHVQILVGRSFDGSRQLERIIDDAIEDDRIPLLLFPGDDAITLEDGDAKEQLHNNAEADNFTSSASKYLLIIVDGTWTQAKRMVRNSPLLLEKCQAIQFTSTSHRSIYDNIRKQPESYCLSTLESCERALKLLEGSNNNNNMKMASYHLLTSLKEMILIQMKYEQKHLEKNPELIRNVSKLKAKKERQQELLAMESSSDSSSRNTNDDNNSTATTRILSSLHLPKGYAMRPLVSETEDDAQYVNSNWPYKSNKSLKMIEKQIHDDNVNTTKYNIGGGGSCSATSTCLGIEFSPDNNSHRKELVGCIMRHRNGSIGILHVDECHRD